jgi:hypothetical protein
MADDDTFSDEDRAHIGHAWREFIEDRAHGGKMHYQMPAVRGMAPPGSFRLPRDVVNKLGDGDPKAGGAVIHQMFGVEDDPDDPTIVHGDVVKIIGNGSLAAGRRVLERFIQRVRHGDRDGVTLEHDASTMGNGHHGWRVGR